MANKFFAAGALSGGGAGALDAIRVIDDGLTNGDLCMAVFPDATPEQDVCILFKYNDDWGGTVPDNDDRNYIQPDYSTGTTAYTGNGRWYAINYGGIEEIIG